VQLSKEHGGLGVKDLELQNRCLLMKFIDKIFSNSDAPWKTWLLQQATPFDSIGHGGDSFLWKIINAELSTYRSLTYVKVQDGASTSFWYDHWLPDGPLYLSHAALFCHTTRPNISVQVVFETNFELCLHPRLTNAASSQLASLLICLQATSLVDAPDLRLMKLTGKSYTSRDAYSALAPGQDAPDAHAQRIWTSRVPAKVKIFSWLYFKDRLSTRLNLVSKHVLDDALCERCLEGVEDRRHAFFECTVNSAVWRRLRLPNLAALSDVDVWNASMLANLEKLWPFVLQTILWRLWDARNGVIFRNENPSARSVISKVCDDFAIWKRRLKDEHDVICLNAWHNRLLSCNTVSSSTPV
jgi:hypothetical protein